MVLFESNKKRWGTAWLALAIALAIHVTDEALTGFLPLYNSIVTELRETYPLLSLPTFTFPIWLGGLIAAVTVLLSLTPAAYAGRLWLRYISYPLSILMILNGVGHIGASLYWGTLAPGVYSSPLLMFAGITLLICTLKIVRESDVCT